MKTNVIRRILQAISKEERHVSMGGSLGSMDFYAPRMVQEYMKGRGR